MLFRSQNTETPKDYSGTAVLDNIDIDNGSNIYQKYDPQTTTWLGKAPDFQDIDMFVNYQKFDYSPTFVEEFNKSPINAIHDLMCSQKEFKDYKNLGPYLMHAKGIYPRALTHYIFCEANMKGNHVSSILYYYFGSVNIEYMSIPAAARLLLSRIAFPNNHNQLEILFNAFATVYSEANPYMELSVIDISQIATACIAFSMFCRKTDVLSQEVFLSFIKTVKMEDIFKKQIYEQIKENPIPIFFLFSTSLQEPNYNKQGYLSVPCQTKMFKGKVTRHYYIIDHQRYNLKYFKDENKSSLIGEIELKGSYTQILNSDKKNPQRLVIRKVDGGTIGYTYSKDLSKKPSDATEHVAFDNDPDVLISWTCALNYVSFW